MRTSVSGVITFSSTILRFVLDDAVKRAQHIPRAPHTIEQRGDGLCGPTLLIKLENHVKSEHPAGSLDQKRDQPVEGRAEPKLRQRDRGVLPSAPELAPGV